jgi:hypothetical protein
MKASIKITGEVSSIHRLYSRLNESSLGHDVRYEDNYTVIVMEFEYVTDARITMSKANRAMKAYGDYIQMHDGISWERGKATSIRLDAATATIITHR